MAYIALSRVTSGAGLYLLENDNDTEKIYCDSNLNKQLDKIPEADATGDWHNVSPQIVSDSHPFLVANHN